MATEKESIIRLNQIEKKVEVSGTFSIDDEFVFEYFNKKVAAKEYDSKFIQALKLGVYALKLDNIGAMLDSTSLQLNGQVMELRQLFELRDLKMAGAAKGAQAEADLAEVLQVVADANKWGDTISRTGEKTGVLPRRKVGDIVIELSDIQSKIVVESKFDRSVEEGDPATADDFGNVNSKLEGKTAVGQSLSAIVNRDAEISIFVADTNNCHVSLKKAGRFQVRPELPGFIVLVDPSLGDYSLLETAYKLARSLCFAWNQGLEKWEAFDLLIARLQREISRLSELDSVIEDIGTSAQSILDSLEQVTGVREAVVTSLEILVESSEVLRKDPVAASAKRDLFLEIEKS